MKVEKVVPEVVYKLELSQREYDDAKLVLMWARDDTDYSFTERQRYGALYKAFADNA